MKIYTHSGHRSFISTSCTCTFSLSTLNVESPCCFSTSMVDLVVTVLFSSSSSSSFLPFSFEVRAVLSSFVNFEVALEFEVDDVDFDKSFVSSFLSPFSVISTSISLSLTFVSACISVSASASSSFHSRTNKTLLHLINIFPISSSCFFIAPGALLFSYSIS
ncbi:conserved hypothetical protein [Lodderomyces elongisporus NRRL YB-4239]|uniref:Uncharacterized protein n=1 Tax=Lodderomyces elongisporus (strain ATCC 11503 / CBS 2605 / JCM 1781 / NBRC 1676 / NRRL YB-4239) TaxID=379508 RepID=A5E2K7_LODEL|nr:conserved hypothetical protein [Lodderomyces elongisporus NRRL YB-4239]